MCYLQDTYHSPCNHWGEPRNYAPCAAGMDLKNTRHGCHNARKIGVTNLETNCRNCRNATVQNMEASARIGDWNAQNPLRGIGNGRGVVARRRLEKTWGYNSTDFPWFVSVQSFPSTPWRGERRRDVVSCTQGLPFETDYSKMRRHSIL